MTIVAALSHPLPHDPRALAAGIDREVVALAKQLPELKRRLSQVTQQAKTPAKKVADDKKAQTQALQQVEQDLASMSPEKAGFV